jgi:hypothetical protein
MFAAVVCVLGLVVGACSHDTDGAVRETTTQTEAEPSTSAVASPEPEDTAAADVFEVDEQGTPSTAAVEADRAFRTVPTSHADCGSVVTTSGWPTTTTTPLDATDCIVAAAASGKLSQYSVTGRDLAGGMEGSMFRIDGPGEIVAVHYTVEPEGTVTFTERQCGSLTPPTDGPVPECS